MTETSERFWARVQVGGPDDCWPWLGAKYRKGYGCFMVEARRSIGVHRYAWMLANGYEPGDLCVLHHCDNPPCCNPRHLFLGTRLDNARDRDAKRHHWAHRGQVPVTRGERNGQAKLTAEQVRLIRKRAESSTQVALAAEFGISRSMIGNIVRGENWK